ncbi:biotin synthase BioB [Verrucomicrobiales bacterium]|nr:biotin synthase BioB [Verrucomicrobiales bacterium]
MSDKKLSIPLPSTGPMTLSELETLSKLPLFELLKRSRAVHEAHWEKQEVQLCTLLSIKTGGCSEDCSYCAQSARYSTGVDAERLLSKDAVMENAHAAKANGSTRFCMGAAWKGVRQGTKRFDEVLEIIRGVSELDMEVCVTLGEVGAEEAQQLRDAGVTAYNHNIDTSPEHYPNIVSTHTFQDRINTLKHVQEAGMAVCCGGILGLGEQAEDRLRMLEILSNLDPQPESVPINVLMPMAGTPMEDSKAVDSFDLIRMIALARIAMPKAKVRLSAGRTDLSKEAQAMCFFAGANSIFYGEKLLTAKNPSVQRDLDLLETLDLKPQAPFADVPKPEGAACVASV